MNTTEIVKGNKYKVIEEIDIGGRYKNKIGDIVEITDVTETSASYKNLRNNGRSNARIDYLECRLEEV